MQHLVTLAVPMRGSVRRYVIPVEVLTDGPGLLRGYQGERMPLRLSGKLFVFAEYGPKVFHTRNVSFPLDVFFFNDAHKLTKATNSPPGVDRIEGYARRVLEVPSRFALFPTVVKDGAELEGVPSAEQLARGVVE